MRPHDVIETVLFIFHLSVITFAFFEVLADKIESDRIDNEMDCDDTTNQIELIQKDNKQQFDPFTDYFCLDLNNAFSEIERLTINSFLISNLGMGAVALYILLFAFLAYYCFPYCTFSNISRILRIIPPVPL